MWHALSLLVAGALAVEAPGSPRGEVLPPMEPAQAWGERSGAVLAGIGTDTLFALGERHGTDDGQDAGVAGSAFRGFAWSAVAGPLGGFIALRRGRTDSAPVPSHGVESLEALEETYREGYASGFGNAFEPRRREAVIVGSMIGSLVWAFALIQVINLPSRAEAEGTLPPDTPTMSPIRTVIPVPGR